MTSVAIDGLADSNRYDPRMAFIETIAPSDARGPLAALYRRFGNRDGTVDNVLRAHSLNPESLEAHCALYMQAMHRPSPLSRVEREIIAVTVSRLNECHY
jgi:alkylhydroperoxidase family enzyme